MAECRIKRVEKRRTKITNVPIAIIPEGLWCCPSPVLFQKTLKSQKMSQRRHTPPTAPPKVSVNKARNHPPNQKNSSSLRSFLVPSDDEISSNSDPSDLSPPASSVRALMPNSENSESKAFVVLGDPETSDLTVVLSGKQGFSVRMSVHKEVLVEHSSLFADKLSRSTPVSRVEIGNCTDVEMYAETVGLMYCKEIKQNLNRKNVAYVLRVLKVISGNCAIEFHFICLNHLNSN